ncbi:hypothetical protein, partial [Alloprevotella tannerae]|uniref:hypothetical protein n=1 Tax=Alloprevotella tannerae TaxID=76122 RepID=UPI0028D7699E
FADPASDCAILAARRFFPMFRRLRWALPRAISCPAPPDSALRHTKRPSIAGAEQQYDHSTWPWSYTLYILCAQGAIYPAEAA